MTNKYTLRRIIKISPFLGFNNKKHLKQKLRKKKNGKEKFLSGVTGACL